MEGRNRLGESEGGIYSRVKSAKTRNLVNAMSYDEREGIENKLFLGQLLADNYAEYHTEIEMLILSSANYTHREISEVLNISRLGVTKRIAKARDVLQEKIIEMMGEDTL